MQSSKGYLITGVVAVSCCHSFVRPTGVVDLQKGERLVFTFLIHTLNLTPLNCRYSNIDYAFASTVSCDLDARIPHIIVTYDIACQWGQRLHERLLIYSATEDVNLRSLKSFCVVVLKFHLIGHSKPCQLNYNLAYMHGVRMTHGEGVETIWSHSMSLATWSHENGPSAHHALLDMHWSGWNWRKLVNLRKFLIPIWSFSISLTFSLFIGKQLKRNLKRSWKFSKTQGKVAAALTKALDSEAIESWMAMMDAYYLNPSHTPNPFKEPTPSKYFHVCFTLSDEYS